MCARINYPFITPAHSHYPHYCNTMVRLLRNTLPPPDPLLICHTPYNIGNDYRERLISGCAGVLCFATPSSLYVYRYEPHHSKVRLLRVKINAIAIVILLYHQTHLKVEVSSPAACPTFQCQKRDSPPTRYYPIPPRTSAARHLAKHLGEELVRVDAARHATHPAAKARGAGATAVAGATLEPRLAKPVGGARG